MAHIKKKAVVAWSSGKDSAYAYHIAQQSGDYDIVGVLTTLSEGTQKVAAHGVREAFLEQQYSRLGVPAYKVYVPRPCSNIVYENRMGVPLQQLKSEGVTHVIFGDLFLDDIRAFRENQMQKLGLKSVFPLWDMPTHSLAKDMIASGLKTILVCVCAEKLGKSFAGRVFDRSLLEDLPADVDPCGEKGEFHTAVIAGPMFENEIPVSFGDVREDTGYFYADILPRSSVVEGRKK